MSWGDSCGVEPRVDHDQIVLREILPQVVELNLFTPVKLHHAKNKTSLLVHIVSITSSQSVNDKANNIITITSPLELYDKSIKCRL